MRNFRGRVLMPSMLTLCLAGISAAADPVLTLSASAHKPLAAPRVAFNTVDKLFLAVYEFHYAAADWDIDGRVVDANGAPLGEGLAIAWSGSIVQQEPDVAYNPVTSQFLVVYALAPDNWKISACLVAGDGTPGPFIPIATSAFKEFHPRVACDPITGEYLVAYEREHELDGVTWREVWAQRVHRDGALIGAPIQMSDPGTHSLGCAVARAGGQFLVVWREEQTDGRGRIQSRFIQCGAVAKSSILVSKLDEDQGAPSVAYNPAMAEYLIVYEAGTREAAHRVIKGTRISTIGQLKGTSVIASAPGEHCRRPAVSCDLSDGTYVVAWAQEASDILSLVPAHRVMVTRVDGFGTPVGVPEQVGGEVYGEPDPAVACGTCARSIVAWDDQQFTWSTGPSVAFTYSILGTLDTWGSSCRVPDCNDLK